MDEIVGIDLGTTNSEIGVIRNGQVEVLADEDGEKILPSVVGLDAEGKILVGRPARNQWILAPERTIRSIKRKMGQETSVRLGDRDYTPQEISAIILRQLKTQAEKALGRPVTKAVITVPAFFNEVQRQATREAGELAGLEVVRIINEPTAAALTYDPHPTEMQRLLVYDLGGGTFDVSIVQIEKGVVEVLSSHGDTQLGGDDFDQLLMDHICDQFHEKNGIDLRGSLASKARVLRAAEDAKKQLSFDTVVKVEEEFVATKDGVPLHLNMELERLRYEELIEPLLDKTLKCLDEALTDAKLQANQIDKVVLVGGATRTPMVTALLQERLGQPVHAEVEPDLAVAMGAAVQGGVIAGIDVGPVLVDITPHTLGIETLGELQGFVSSSCFSPIIDRNSALPTSRTQTYTTVYDSQKSAMIRVFQGEDGDTRHNDFVGEFLIEGLSQVPRGNQVLVKLELDLNGILKVTATERSTGLNKQIMIDSAIERFRKRERVDAKERLADAFSTMEQSGAAAAEAEVVDDLPEELRAPVNKARTLIAKAERLAGQANPEDAQEMSELAGKLEAAIIRRQLTEINEVSTQLEDVVFYIEDR